MCSLTVVLLFQDCTVTIPLTRILYSMEEMSNVKGLIPFVGGDVLLVRCELTFSDFLCLPQAFWAATWQRLREAGQAGQPQASWSGRHGPLSGTYIDMLSTPISLSVFFTRFILRLITCNLVFSSLAELFSVFVILFVRPAHLSVQDRGPPWSRLSDNTLQAYFKVYD
jgi:hypothetical protein